MKIPEKENPKKFSMGFKVSADDKQLIEKFVEDKNYRMSAFLRVAVLSYIKNEEEKIALR